MTSVALFPSFSTPLAFNSNDCTRHVAVASVRRRVVIDADADVAYRSVRRGWQDTCPKIPRELGTCQRDTLRGWSTDRLAGKLT